MVEEDRSEAAIDAHLDAFVDEIFDTPGVGLYGRIDAAQFAQAQRILAADDATRSRYAVSAVAKIVSGEEAFKKICDAYVPGQPKTPERENPAIRAMLLSNLFEPLVRRGLPFTRDQLLAMLNAMNRCDVLSERYYPLLPIVKQLSTIESPDAELKQAIAGMCTRIAAGYSRNRALKNAAAKLSARLAQPATANAAREYRPVVRGFTGHPQVLRDLKIQAKLIPDDATPVGRTEVGPDRFPLRADSILAKEHAVWTAMLEDWAALPNWLRRTLADSEVGQQILAEPSDVRGRLLLALGERLVHGETTPTTWEDQPHQNACQSPSRCVQALIDTDWTLPRDLFFDALLIAAIARERFYSGTSVDTLRRIIESCRHLDAQQVLSEPERYVLSLLRVAVIEGGLFGRDESLLRELSDLIGDATAGDVLAANETWVETLYARLLKMTPVQHTAWTDLLRHAASAPAGKPTARWLKLADTHIGKIGNAAFADALVACLTEFVTERHDPIWNFTLRGHARTGFQLGEPNATAMKGLVLMAATLHHVDLPRAIAAVAASAYRKIPGVGPRAVSLGNACVAALGRFGNERAVGQLAALKARVKFGTAQKEIEKAFNAAAAALGLPRDQIEELGVPTYGLEDVGLRTESFGDITATIRVDGRDVSLEWTSAGKPVKSVPAKMKADHKDELKELQGAVKDIAAMLPAQSERLDAMFLLQKTWPAFTWRERYLNHPLVGTLSRRLVWSIKQGDGEQTVIWLDGKLVNVDDEAVDVAADATVSLWHPIGRPVDDVLSWRAWLQRHEVRQPFKQAHREIYVLTDAERRTNTYSNRFAAHVLRQHQFHALCAARGWKNRLRLMVDDSYPPATRELPLWNLRAEYWIEGAGDDTLDSGAYRYLATDQVRFYRIAAAPNTAHAGGGGYGSHAAGSGQNNVNDPLPLDQIPPLVLSEIFRDVDLFVGVASLGNDPTWQDGGPERRYQTYWQNFSFGELSETARTRKAVLETLLPRLTKLKDRWTLDDRFLVIRGTLRTYKIHLGSANILMEPNDQYLCIVPDASTRKAGGADNLFLPFEGDSVLSIILSKAFLLANDTAIKDATITRQIQAK